MAKKHKKRRKVRKSVIIGAIALGYFGVLAYNPFLLATKWKASESGVNKEELENIIEEVKIPLNNIDGLVFMKVNEDYFRNNGSGDAGATYSTLPSMIFFPDSDKPGFLHNKAQYFRRNWASYVQ